MKRMTIKTRAPEPPEDVYSGRGGVEILVGATRYFVEGTDKGDAIKITMASGRVSQMEIQPRYANVVILGPGRA